MRRAQPSALSDSLSCSSLLSPCVPEEPCCACFERNGCILRCPGTGMRTPLILPLLALAVAIALVTLFLWKPPGDVSAWKVEYALVALYFGCAGYVLGMSEDWSRLVHNRQAAMRAMSSMRAWRRFKQASFLAGAFRSPVAAATAAAHADVSTPDEFDARMCPLWPWIPGVSPVSSPASQRRAFWSCALISSCAFPALAYGLMKTQILPGGALGVGIVVLISAPPINWTLLGPYGNAHNGNPVLIALLEACMSAVGPLITSITMACQLRYDSANPIGLNVASLILGTSAVVSGPFLLFLLFATYVTGPVVEASNARLSMEDASTDTSSMDRLAVILNRATTVVSFCQQVLLVAAVAVITARDGYAMLHAEPGYPSLQSGKSSSVIPLSIIVSIIISAGTLCSSIVMKAALNLSLPDWRSMCIQLPSRSLMYILAFSLGFVGTDWAHSRGMIVFPTLIHCCVHAFLVSITSLCVWRARVSSAGAVSLRNPLLNFTGPTWAAGDDAHRQIFASDVESKVSDDSADSVTSSGRHGGRGKTRDEAAQRYKDVLTEAAAVARQGAVEAEGKGTRTTIHRRGQFSQSAPAVESSGEEANPDTDPSVWVSAIDQRSGNVYYSNRSTGEVSWSPPEGFVEVTDWIQLVSANGRPYFYSASLNKTVWRQPPGYQPHVSLPGEVSSSEAAESVSVPVGPAGLEPMGDMTGRKRVHFGDTLQASIEMIDQRLKSRTSAVDDSSVAAADVDPPVSDYTTPSDSAAPANAAEDVVVESGVTSMMSEARQRAQVAAAADPSGKGKDKAFFAEMKRAKEEEAKRKAEEKLAAMTSEERAEHERQEKEAKDREAKKQLLLQRSLGGYSKKPGGGRSPGTPGRK